MANLYTTISLKALKFILIFLAIDFVVGSAAGYLFFRQKSGKYERITTSLEKADGDLLIFGSSHANRNYVPSVLEDSMGISCFNAGVQGQKILFHNVVQDIMLKRISPKMIVLTLDPLWLYADPSVYDRMADIHPYYWRYKKEIKPVISLKSPYEPYKMYLNSYRYNSTIVHIIKYLLVPQKDYKGYRPLYGKGLLPKLNKENADIPLVRKDSGLDPNFIDALSTFITRAQKKDIKVIFAVSPRYNEVDYSQNQSWAKIREIAAIHQVPLYDYLFHPEFLRMDDLFYDAIHLNHKGALKYSSIFAQQLKRDFHELWGNAGSSSKE